MYVMTDEDGRITATTDAAEYATGMAEMAFPDGFDFSAQREWRVVDGELVHDPPDPDPAEERAGLVERLRETDYVVTKLAEAMCAGYELPDEDRERYAQVIVRRREWRERIGELDGNE